MKSVPDQLVRLRGMMEDQAIGQESPEYATYIENMEHDPAGFWRPVPGTQAANSISFSAYGAVFEMTTWKPTPGISRTVVETGELGSSASELNWMSPVDGSLVYIAARRRNPGQWRVQPWLHYGRWLYHFNGLELPIRWNGKRVSPAGYDRLPPTPRVSDATADAVGLKDTAAAGIYAATYNSRVNQRGVGEFVDSGTAAWRYACGVTVINDAGQESPMSGIVWARGENNTTAGKKLIRWKVPRMADHIRAVRLWRSTNLEGVTGNGTPVMYLVEQFEMAGEFVYLDHMPDLELGGGAQQYDPDAVGLLPLAAHSPAVWQGTGFLLLENRVIYSTAGLIEQYPSQNYLPIASPEFGRPITTLAVPRGVLVFCEHAVLMVKGDAVNGFRLDTISTKVGTTAPAAIVSVPNQGTFFLDSIHGPQLIQGTLDDSGPTAVSPVGGIRTTWKRECEGADLTVAAAVYRPDVQEVWWSLPLAGDYVQRYGLALHLLAGGWSVRRHFTWTTGVFDRGLAIAGWDSSVDGGEDPAAATGGVQVLLTGAGSTMGHEGVQGIYETGVMVSERGARSVSAVELGVVANGEVDIGLEMRTDRASNWTSVADTDRQARHTADSHPDVGGELDQPVRVVREVWQDGAATGASGLWSAARVWTDYEATTLVVSVPPEQAHEHQFRLTTTYGQVYGIRPRFNPVAGQQPREEAY